MRATEILINEHRVIEQVLDCLEAIVDQANQLERLDAAAASQAIDFFKTFADGCHHAKEENFLFPMMEQKGFPRHGGPTGVMLHEHEIGREQIGGMADSLDGAAKGNPESLRRFTSHARTYVDLLRQHIFKENQMLFPMADRALTSQDQQDLLKAFGALEEEEMKPGTHESYLQIADALAKQFHVQTVKAAVGALPLCGSCGGAHSSR